MRWWRSSHRPTSTRPFGISASTRAWATTPAPLARSRSSRPLRRFPPGNLDPPLLPLRAREDPGPYLDQARHHVEHRYPTPRLPIPCPKPLLVQVTDDARIGEIL